MKVCTKRVTGSESALRSAAVATAMMAATDEEFAAGIPLSDPGSIIARGHDSPKSKKPVKRRRKAAK